MLTRGVRLAAWSGVACPPLTAAVLLAAGWLSPGYDPVRFTISHLGQRGEPFALAVNLSVATLGLAVVGVAWALGRAVGLPARASAATLAVAGIALVGVAIVTRDPARPAAHRAIALLLFLSLAVAPLVLGRRLRREPGWARHAALSLGTAVVSAALLVAGLAGVVLGGLPAGAWERTFVAVNLLWLTLVATRLLTMRRQKT